LTEVPFCGIIYVYIVQIVKIICQIAQGGGKYTPQGADTS